jgi:hypothetical protein
MTVVTAVGEGMLLGVAPTFHGFHPIWASARYQADICNNVDDLIIRDGADGTLYRLPITKESIARHLGRLVAAMNAHDTKTGSPWAEHNVRIRGELIYAATRRANGTKPQSLNTFNPGMIAPALSNIIPDEVDQMLAQMIEQSGDTRIPGQ